MYPEAAVTEEALRALPKAEVHVHLEGTLDVGPISAATRPRDLPSLLARLDRACAAIRTREELARVAYRLAEREAASRVRYADVIVNPTHWPAWRGDLGGFVDAIDAGLREAEQDGLPPAGLCISLLRRQTAEEATDLVEWLVGRRPPRVVALSIDGDEAAAGRTGPRFAEAFSRAAGAGIHRTVHAGESSGPGGVRDALDLLLAERIDHGVRAVEDPSLLAELAKRRVPLGICPRSNVALGLYPDLARHPIETLRRAGVPVSVNTDDPALLGTTLVEEYAAVARQFGWSAEDVRSVARTSIDASFCHDELRQSLMADLARWPSG